VTFSLVALDPGDGAWGVAVASRFLAVGAMVPWGRAGAGAIATQASANLAYGPDGLALLAGGASAEDVVRRLTGADGGRAQRQLGVVDAKGRGATWTGEDCVAWAGGQAGDGFAAQGNVLAGPGVVEAMVRAWHDTAGPLAGRLLAALAAGDRAGGDRRGRQGAALRVWRAGGAYGGVLDAAVDLRVDDHAAPVEELARLLDLHERYFGKADPATLQPLEGELAAEVAANLERLGYGPARGAGLQPALAAWAGMENYEERLVPGMLDPVLRDALAEQAAPRRRGAAPG
jgi:uncharacterized Ntn-hydrolase superfamily protein